MQIKYVMINEAFPVLFVTQMHSDMKDLGGTITSAGFVRLAVRDGQLYVETYGASTSLGLRPGEHDAEIIAMMLGAEVMPK